jgi:transcriptional regulator with PAS, ATPase and Fis domain
VHTPLPDFELRVLFAELGCHTASASMLPVLRLAQKASCVSDITVLIEGETGTGKQVLANAIHKLDRKRSPFPFVTVHSGTITEALAESELFGHQKGAFSGAIQNRRGLFEAAAHGTLFLDDINDLPLALQSKLLDVLQRKVMRAVGSDQEIPLQARIIAASNKPLLPLVEQERFRADLYHRLNVVKLSLPALRQRTADIPDLILAFAAQHTDIYPQITAVEPDLVRYLEPQPFPGNVRELEHAVERMLFQKTEGGTLGISDWIAQSPKCELELDRDAFHDAAGVLWNAILHRGLTYNEAMHQLEGKLLEAALHSGKHTRREIALRLQTSERTLYHRLRSHRKLGSAAPEYATNPT